MRVAWITVRRWADFCSTTTDALAHGLVRKGHTLTLFNADQQGSHNQFPWEHVALSRSTLPGRRAATLAKSGYAWFKEHKNQQFDLIIIDWPLVSPLGTFLSSRGYPLVLMDRSPPADASILASLQWRIWKKAWKMVAKGVFKMGFAVSEGHREYAMKRTVVKKEDIHCLPAGVDLEHYSTIEKRFEGEWKFIYHGRLDKNRGILALPMMVQKLKNKGFKVKLTLIGEGDASNALRQMSLSNPSISVLQRVPRQEIPFLLSQHHIGLLPMPASKVWKLASPLKRSEYLAAGLFVYGIDHQGHRLDHADRDWFRLSPQDSFHNDVTDWVAELSALSEEDYQERASAARNYAEQNCSWESSITQFEASLQACVIDS